MNNYHHCLKGNSFQQLHFPRLHLSNSIGEWLVSEGYGATIYHFKYSFLILFKYSLVFYKC